MKLPIFYLKAAGLTILFVLVAVAIFCMIPFSFITSLLNSALAWLRKEVDKL